MPRNLGLACLCMASSDCPHFCERVEVTGEPMHLRGAFKELDASFFDFPVIKGGGSLQTSCRGFPATPKPRYGAFSRFQEAPDENK
jgi:hypothetical protein